MLALLISICPSFEFWTTGYLSSTPSSRITNTLRLQMYYLLIIHDSCVSKYIKFPLCLIIVHINLDMYTTCRALVLATHKGPSFPTNAQRMRFTAMTQPSIDEFGHFNLLTKKMYRKTRLTGQLSRFINNLCR